MTPKEYKNKMMVKVVGDTYLPTDYTKKLLGKIYEVMSIDYKRQEIRVFTADKLDYFTFNLSDVQIATPVMYEGVNVCVGDMIKNNGIWLQVYDYEWWSGEHQLLVDFDYTQTIKERNIQALDPLYKEVKEELAVGSEVEIKTENGKVYKATINNIK
jgi:hypothetical protein